MGWFGTYVYYHIGNVGKFFILPNGGKKQELLWSVTKKQQHLRHSSFNSNDAN